MKIGSLRYGMHSGISISWISTSWYHRSGDSVPTLANGSLRRHFISLQWSKFARLILSTPRLFEFPRCSLFKVSSRTSICFRRHWRTAGPNSCKSSTRYAKVIDIHNNVSFHEISRWSQTTGLHWSAILLQTIWTMESVPTRSGLTTDSSPSVGLAAVNARVYAVKVRCSPLRLNNTKTLSS